MTHHADDGGSKDLWNVGKLLPDYTALQPRRQPSSYSPPWEPQILTFREIRGGRSCNGAGFTPNSSGFIPPLLHTHLSPPHEVCDIPDQAAHYHTLGTKLRASSLIRHLDDLGGQGLLSKLKKNNTETTLNILVRWKTVILHVKFISHRHCYRIRPIVTRFHNGAHRFLRTVYFSIVTFHIYFKIEVSGCTQRKLSCAFSSEVLFSPVLPSHRPVLMILC
jgi:hypothetical protein